VKKVSVYLPWNWNGLIELFDVGFGRWGS